MTPYETFLQLHHQPTPVLIGNVWDVVGAKIFEQKGFKALATSSAAVARTLGYEDGEQMPFDLLLMMVERIIKNINVPLSVDMEGGYSRSIPGIIQNIERLYALGAVGINIEDTAKDGTRQMMPLDEFQAIINTIANYLAANNMQMFINARTDALLHKLPSPITETIKRAKAYENAGATGIFVPFLDDTEDIVAVVQSTSLPVNVFVTPHLPSFGVLAALGIKRISMGGALQKNAAASLEKAITTIQQEQSFRSLFQ